MVRVNICLGVDWGRQRVGVAVSDELGLLAHPLATIEARSLGDVVTRLTDLARERGADTVVLGIPRHMNGAEGDSATAAALLGRRLAEGGLRVEYVDERLTTVEAEARLRDGAGCDPAQPWRSTRWTAPGDANLGAYGRAVPVNRLRGCRWTRD